MLEKKTDSERKKSFSQQNDDAMFGILLVENDIALRQTIAGILRSSNLGIHVQEAKDGTESFAAFTRQRVDLVVMDIRLDAENGLALAERIKAQYPKVLMVIHSIHDGDEYRRIAKNVGADYFLSKTTNSIVDMITIVRAARHSCGTGSNLSSAWVNRDGHEAQ